MATRRLALSGQLAQRGLPVRMFGSAAIDLAPLELTAIAARTGLTERDIARTIESAMRGSRQRADWHFDCEVTR